MSTFAQFVSVPPNQTPPSLSFINYLNVCAIFLIKPFFFRYSLSTWMCVPLDQPPASFFLLSIVWMCECSPSNQTLPSFSSKFLFHQWLRKCVCTPPIRPFLFSLFGWLFVCDLRKCVCTPPNQTLPFFLYNFLFDYLHSIHMNVCAPPIKPLLSSLSLNFWQFTQVYVCSPLSNHSFSFFH